MKKYKFTELELQVLHSFKKVGKPPNSNESLMWFDKNCNTWEIASHYRDVVVEFTTDRTFHRTIGNINLKVLLDTINNFGNLEFELKPFILKDRPPLTRLIMKDKDTTIRLVSESECEEDNNYYFHPDPNAKLISFNFNMNESNIINKLHYHPKVKVNRIIFFSSGQNIYLTNEYRINYLEPNREILQKKYRNTSSLKNFQMRFNHNTFRSFLIGNYKVSIYEGGVMTFENKDVPLKYHCSFYNKKSSNSGLLLW